MAQTAIITGAEGITVFIDRNANGIFDGGDINLHQTNAFNDNDSINARAVYQFQARWKGTQHWWNGNILSRGYR